MHSDIIVPERAFYKLRYSVSDDRDSLYPNVRDGVDGLVLRQRNVDSLCAAMELACDQRLRRQWAARAAAGRERFDRNRFIVEQVRIYETCVPAACVGALLAI